MLPGPQNGLNYIMKSLVFSLIFIHFDIIMGLQTTVSLPPRRYPATQGRGDNQYRHI